MLLYSAAANLLNFDGYTTELICESLQTQRQGKLEVFYFSISGCGGREPRGLPRGVLFGSFLK
jgi:hypothetical protein